MYPTNINKMNIKEWKGKCMHPGIQLQITENISNKSKQYIQLHLILTFKQTYIYIICCPTTP